MFLNLNHPQSHTPHKVGTLSDNTTTQFQDDNYGCPNPPVAAPVFGSWTSANQGGSFVGGNKVRYAVTFFNSVGESARGPWTDWIAIEGGSAPQLTAIPTDATEYANCPTTGRNLYRVFQLKLDGEVIGTAAQKVLSIADNTTTTCTDLDWGAPMPPAVAPSLPVGTPWAQSTPSGGWVSGNQVYYAVSFVNSQGQESPIGPWSAPTTVGAYALPIVQDVPTDNSSVDPASATTGRNVYRCFSIGAGKAVVSTPVCLVGSIDDNTTVTFQDNDYGAPNPPADAPAITSWWDVPNGGSFLSGNQVSYALSYVAQNGAESAPGPWSAWTPIGLNSGPQFNALPIDVTPYIHNPTTGKNLYRRFQLQFGKDVVTTPMQKVLGLDLYTEAATDQNLGAPMPPTAAPGALQSWTSSTPSGEFAIGNQVAYAVSYVNAAGEESLCGPWSAWTPVGSGQNALPLVADLPVDGSLVSGTTSRNVYRIFNAATHLAGAAAKMPSRAAADDSAPQGTLKLNYIKCVQPSSGVASTFNTIMAGAAIGGGAIVTVGGVIALATAPTGVGPVAGAVIALVGGGIILLAEGASFIVDAIGSSSADELYLVLNETRVWPTPIGTTYKIKKGQQVALSLTQAFTGNSIAVQLHEHDTVSEDDPLVNMTIDISGLDVGSSISYMEIPISSSDEHSIYILGMSCTRTA